MYVFCVYPAMSKKLENLSDLNKKDRNKRHTSPFINGVKGVFFVTVKVNFRMSLKIKIVRQWQTNVPYFILSCNQYICCTNMINPIIYVYSLFDYSAQQWALWLVNKISVSVVHHGNYVLKIASKFKITFYWLHFDL
jgi:hypothetical protein